MLIANGEHDLFADAGDQFGGVDALPKVRPAATLTKLKKHLKSSTMAGSMDSLNDLVGNDSEEAGGDVTVSGVVKSQLLFQGAKIASDSKGDLTEAV